MKTLIALLATIFVVVPSFAHPPKPTACYGNAAVPQSIPYILMVNGLDSSLRYDFSQDLIDDGLLYLTGGFDAEDALFFNIGVVPDAAERIGSADKVEIAVRDRIQEVADKYKTTYEITCNGWVTPQPRSGGAN